MDNKKITATQVCNKLNISVVTLTNWYKWYNDDSFEKPKGMPPLPPYEQASSRATRYWNSKDLPMIKAFQKWIPKGRGGVMGEYNKRFWSEYNKKKAMKDKEE